MQLRAKIHRKRHSVKAKKVPQFDNTLYKAGILRRHQRLRPPRIDKTRAGTIASVERYNRSGKQSPPPAGSKGEWSRGQNTEAKKLLTFACPMHVANLPYFLCIS